jgi:predicted HicB family RNase H-like nuclease
MKQNGYFRFRLPQDLLDKAQEKAKKDDIKLSSLIREFLNQFTKEDSK